MKGFMTKINTMVVVNLIILMAVCILVNLNKILHMDLEFIGKLMAVNILDFGQMINNMALVENSGMMEDFTKDFMLMERKMEEVSISGPIITIILEIGKLITSMGKECSNGMIRDSILGSGGITRCMVKVLTC